MNSTNIMGIIYSNSYDECLPELAAIRTMGSVPFAGRYRLIDVALSNFVNSGIEKVGVVTSSNYRSLLDHIGQGKAWDLSRKNSGLAFLPPFNGISVNGDKKLNSLIANISYISDAKEEYVVLCGCNTVANIDIKKVVNYHIAKGADVTLISSPDLAPGTYQSLALDFDADGKITEVRIAPRSGEKQHIFTNICVIRKTILEQFLGEAAEIGYSSFERDFFMRYKNTLKMYVYELDGFVRTIDSLRSYFAVSMELLQKENRDSLFDANRPILTKTHDDTPSAYYDGSYIADSLVSDGCKIRGSVSSSILSRGVVIEEGAVVKNCIIMQSAVIGKNAVLENCILDKDTAVRPGKHLAGAEDYPFFIGKGITV